VAFSHVHISKRPCYSDFQTELYRIFSPRSNTMSKVHVLYTPCCLPTSQQQRQDRGSIGPSTPSLSSQSLPQTPQDIEDPLGSPFKIYNDDGNNNNENAPPSTAATFYTRGPLLERELMKVHCCDVAEALLRSSKRTSKRKAKKRLEYKIRRIDFDIGEAKRTLEYLNTERNGLVEEYTQCLLRRTDKRHHRSDDSDAHAQVGLGICLPELADPDTRLSMHDGIWPEKTSEMTEVVAEGRTP
jgi:hypothetical protein